MLVRVHSECLTGDVFHSLRCDCGEQLESALAMIEHEGRGVLLYLSQEGRGIGLLNKLRAYKLQEEGLDTVDANLRLGLPADLRDYGIGAQILVDLGLTSIRILTNNPKKISGLAGYGLSVTDQIPIQHVANPHNEAYLRAKRERLGHTLHHQGLALDEEMIQRRAGAGPRRDDGAEPAGRAVRGALLRRSSPTSSRRARARRWPRPASRSVDRFDVPGAFELPLAAKYAAAVGPLRRRRLPRRGDPRRDRPLRLRLRRGRARDPAGAARDRRPVRLRRADRRHDGAGARPRQRAAPSATPAAHAVEAVLASLAVKDELAGRRGPHRLRRLTASASTSAPCRDVARAVAGRGEVSLALPCTRGRAPAVGAPAAAACRGAAAARRRCSAPGLSLRAEWPQRGLELLADDLGLVGDLQSPLQDHGAAWGSPARRSERPRSYRA